MEPALGIRERAYEIWNATGREDGRADEHWLSAERELLVSARRQPIAEGIICRDISEFE
jgi:hypothetical protein